MKLDCSFESNCRTEYLPDSMNKAAVERRALSFSKVLYTLITNDGFFEHMYLIKGGLQDVSEFSKKKKKGSPIGCKILTSVPCYGKVFWKMLKGLLNRHKILDHHFVILFC